MDLSAKAAGSLQPLASNLSTRFRRKNPTLTALSDFVGSIVPLAPRYENCRATLVAGTVGDHEISADFAALSCCPVKRNRAVVSFKFEDHRSARDKAT